MQSTFLPASVSVEQSALGEIVHRGWLNLKIRSMVNVRPRHMRYCVLTRDNQMLSTFKFQPSSGDLASLSAKPLRMYKVLGVAPWNGRKFAFLVSVTQQSDQVDRILEVDAPMDSAAQEWIQYLRLVVAFADPLSDVVPMPTALPPRSLSEGDADKVVKKQSDLWVKGASVHRGLLNASGENSCFLNVIIQSFWHLTSMRHFLLHVEIKEESKTVEANVLRALKSIMTLYDDTSSGTIHSRGLRKGLSVLYAADKNFQEGAMYDAEETLLALLNLMHQQTEATQMRETQTTQAIVKSLVRVVSQDNYEETADAVFDENSIPHLVFSHQIYDRYVCNSCQHSTTWDLYSNLVFTTYAVDLYSKKYESMEQMIRHISLEGGDIAASCDQKDCKGKNVKERTIHRFPMVFAVSVLWATNSATKEQIHGLLENIENRVDLAKCFDAAGPATKFKHGGLRTTYRLRGFVCYYGQHYVAVFYSTAHKAWLLFDDSRVLDLGTWEDVQTECLKGRFQIVLVFYELPDQRKDSSVSLFSVNESFAAQRKKSSSISSIQGDLLPGTIEESPEEEAQHSPAGKLTSVQEDTGSSSPMLSPQSDKTTAVSSSTAEMPEEPAVEQSEPAPVAADPEPAPAVEPTVTLFDVPVNREFELAELEQLGIAAQDILPVSAAIAMCPRTLPMNSPCEPDEYDVRFSEDSVILGMFLEKLGPELCVTRFPRSVTGEMFGAEKCGHIGLYDLVLQANGHPLQHYPVDRVLKMIKAQSRPLILRFRRSPRVQKLVDMGFARDKAITALLLKRGDVQAAANYCFETQ
ncbi:hypothetical protein Poli38472_003674 [Pythium oligandrum]|uniref:Uncharacterized protein n=1 Tax=Pythium oligandrum TaxID=41045 RepID=A0A8K1FM44_PYTOL|nr:hypothetical protein Poli38472_003674 [Pythium oligandrum]|eukprot:TMW65909.1 hypothetical protein Poli38472_003674 [Pythium oligandrum]